MVGLVQFSFRSFVLSPASLPLPSFDLELILRTSSFTFDFRLASVIFRAFLFGPLFLWELSIQLSV